MIRMKEVYPGHAAEPTRVIPLESRRNSGGDEESQYSELLKTGNLLTLRVAKSPRIAEIALNWNVFGTRGSPPPRGFAGKEKGAQLRIYSYLYFATDRRAVAR
jgi:hypothetical protein